MKDDLQKTEQELTDWQIKDLLDADESTLNFFMNTKIYEAFISFGGTEEWYQEEGKDSNCNSLRKGGPVVCSYWMDSYINGCETHRKYGPTDIDSNGDEKYFPY